MKRWTIYCHTHIESGRCYIGLTSQTMLARWKTHVYSANRSKGGRWHFPNAIRKYGPEAFKHEVLEICDSLEEANEREKYHINRLDACNPEKGFNLAKGGEHKPHSYKNPWDRPEYRVKSELAAKKRWEDPDFRAKLEMKQKEVHTRPEWKANMSAASRQAFSKPEVRQRHSDSLKGKKLSAEHCAKISDNLRKNQASPDVKEKLSVRSKAIWGQPGFRERQIESHTGKTTSEETRSRISASCRSSDPEVRAKISIALKKHFALHKEF